MTSVDPGTAAQAHHVFPNKFGQRFANVEINANEVSYGTWWETVDHQATAAEYNDLWAEFLSGHPSREAILTYGRSLGFVYGFQNKLLKWLP